MEYQNQNAERKKVIAHILLCARVFMLASALACVCMACGQKEDGAVSQPAAESDVDESEEDSYTYRTAIADFPTNWSPASAQTAADAQLMMYLTASLYGFDYNDAMDGCVIKPSAAAGLPVDVTARYAEQWGIEAGEIGRVWSIPLRDDVKWEDGSRINANTYEKSVQMILDPVAGNLRAGMFFDGSFCVIGAEAYQRGGRFSDLVPMTASSGRNEYIQTDEFDVGEDGTFSVNGREIVLDLRGGGQWDSSFGEYELDGFFVNADGVDVYREILLPAADADGLIPVTRKIYDAACFCIAACRGYGSTEEYADAVGNYAYLEAQKMCCFASRNPKISFDEVGITAVSNYELVIALEQPVELAELCYALTDSFLIKESLYLRCEHFGRGYSNTYGTSAETTASCGPYRLDSFSKDGEFVLVRNENYFDLYKKYQTTRCVVRCIKDSERKKELFLSGQLDSYRLTADDTKTVAGSDYTYYAAGTSAYFVVMNPDEQLLIKKQEALGEGYNKTILTLLEFRRALSCALDRSAFIMTAAPNRQPLKGLFSERGLLGEKVSESVAYTQEERRMLEEITGYDAEKAKECFSQAYQIALRRGILNQDDVVRITIGIPNGSSVFYKNGYAFLTQCWTQAAVDTPFEGKLVFDVNDTLGNEYAAALQKGEADILFGVGLEGAALEPYRLMRYYAADEHFRYNSYRDPYQDMLTVRLGETDYTASVADWAQALISGSVTVTDKRGNELLLDLMEGAKESEAAGAAGDASAEKNADGASGDSSEGAGSEDLRPQVFKALERSVLETYELLPLMDDFTVQIRGKKICYPTKDYVQGMGFGGLAYYTYHYSDAEWEAYVANHDGMLNYE